jgi:hypothetical protein
MEKIQSSWLPQKDLDSDHQYFEDVRKSTNASNRSLLGLDKNMLHVICLAVYSMQTGPAILGFRDGCGRLVFSPACHWSYMTHPIALFSKRFPKVERHELIGEQESASTLVSLIPNGGISYWWYSDWLSPMF